MATDEGAARLVALAGALSLLSGASGVERVERAERAAVRRACEACGKARDSLRKRLLADARMPLLVNYRERYEALACKNDAQQVLRLLRGTLGLVPLALERAHAVDVPAAVGDAAAAYAEALGRVTGNSVGLSGAWKGQPLLCADELPTFPGVPAGEAGERPEDVRALAQEVDISFTRFSEVVGDNGLYAAFPGSYGFTACDEQDACGWGEDDETDVECRDPPEAPACGMWLVDEDAPRVPLRIQEEPGGDSTERAVQRMRAFNRRAYHGFLDDDFEEHVDAFWYGYAKLMQASNELVTVDLRPLAAWCDAADEVLVASAGRACEKTDVNGHEGTQGGNNG